MKYTELSSKSAQELESALKDQKKNAFELKIRLKTMQTQNSREIRATKKDIARIKTAMRALQIKG
jgi:large subunit ribosomal protein L29